MSFPALVAASSVRGASRSRCTARNAASVVAAGIVRFRLSSSAAAARPERRIAVAAPAVWSTSASRSISSSSSSSSSSGGGSSSAEAFANIDTNRDGAVSPGELVTAAPLDLFRYVDKDGDGHITQAEFSEAVDALPEKELRVYAHAAFRAIDADGDGFLTEKEFKDGLGLYSKGELDRLRASLSRNELSKTDQDADVPTTIAASLASRFQVTAEVALSKLLPGGFGWQYMSGVAETMGFGADDPSFWLLAGLGDALGVFIGHWVWEAGAKALGRKTDLVAEAHTSLLLGTAAMFSGTAWQPTVNLLHDSAGFGFNATVLGTGVVTAACFFTGLRISRVLYSPFTTIAEPSYANLKADAWLSGAIGGATGTFVGTDVSFEGANWMRGFLGIEDSTGALVGCFTAGSSTAIGFSAVQSLQNATLPAGKNWVD